MIIGGLYYAIHKINLEKAKLHIIWLLFLGKLSINKNPGKYSGRYCSK